MNVRSTSMQRLASIQSRIRAAKSTSLGRGFWGVWQPPGLGKPLFQPHRVLPSVRHECCSVGPSVEDVPRGQIA